MDVEKISSFLEFQIEMSRKNRERRHVAENFDPVGAFSSSGLGWIVKINIGRASVSVRVGLGASVLDKLKQRHVYLRERDESDAPFVLVFTSLPGPECRKRR